MTKPHHLQSEFFLKITLVLRRTLGAESSVTDAITYGPCNSVSKKNKQTKKKKLQGAFQSSPKRNDLKVGFMRNLQVLRHIKAFLISFGLLYIILFCPFQIESHSCLYHCPHLQYFRCE